MAVRHRYFVSLQNRGVLTLPAAVRRRYRLDEPGTQVEVVERDDGVLELHPHAAVPADQAWFWSPEWQDGEREASADIEAGRVERFDDEAGLVDALRSR
ncbi:MAG: AbrB/MazE/SpoVT family DNA-binding domain-containing protein [Actinomycetota bacterium]|nr:AbrB/MazE/SpoVT family DNA-binding domain-containing protein [Actinomycetota bacterium]MDQ2980723.1 AbrB/MazE/SpoVT family DNA-binding domain-containing protein [Actinomycetota bacterium]